MVPTRTLEGRIRTGPMTGTSRIFSQQTIPSMNSLYVFLGDNIPNVQLAVNQVISFGAKGQVDNIHSPRFYCCFLVGRSTPLGRSPKCPQSTFGHFIFQDRIIIQHQGSSIPMWIGWLRSTSKTLTTHRDPSPYLQILRVFWVKSEFLKSRLLILAITQTRKFSRTQIAQLGHQGTCLPTIGYTVWTPGNRLRNRSQESLWIYRRIWDGLPVWWNLTTCALKESIPGT